MLTKTEIARAVEAIRSLSGVIEKLHKSTWPDAAENDVLRKVEEPRASEDDVAKRALDMLADLTRQVDNLKAADAPRANADVLRKTYEIRQS